MRRSCRVFFAESSPCTSASCLARQPAEASTSFSAVARPEVYGKPQDQRPLILERQSPTKDQRVVEQSAPSREHEGARIGLDCLALSWRVGASKAPLKSLTMRCEVRVPKEARSQGTGRQVAAANQEAIGYRACKTASRRKAEPTCHEDVGKAAKTSSHLRPDPGSGALRRLYACA